MEAVYLKNKKFSENVSENVHLKEYFQEYSKTAKSFEPSHVSLNNYLTRLTGLNSKICAEVSAKLSLRNVTVSLRKQKLVKVFVPGKMLKSGFTYAPPVNAPLKSLYYLRTRTKAETKAISHVIKYHGELDLEDERPNVGLSIKTLIPSDDYLLTVRIYVPSPHSKMTGRKFRPTVVSQEFIVSSKTPLDAIRDRIACASEFESLEGDISQNPFTFNKICAKDVFRSAMFYIGNVFYIDCRYSDNLDYSEPVRKWGRTKKLDLDYIEPMEMSKVSDLKFRLGYPYLYQHQGDCEHLIVFTDARLLDRSDSLCLDWYPILKSISNLKGRHCMLCGKRIAKFVVTNTERLPNDETYVCTICLYLFNYVQLKKVDNFSVYRYIDRSALL